MRRIHCAGCGKYLGEIRDATLRKGIVHLCDGCNMKRLASDLANKTAPKSPFEDLMDNFFSGSRR